MENYLTETKNVFEGLISTLDTVEERIQDKSREITQTETQIENEWKKIKGTGHPKATGQYNICIKLGKLQ